MLDSGSEPEITPEEAKASPPPPADERAAGDDALEEGAAQLAPLQPQGPGPEADPTFVARIAAALAPQLDDFKVELLTEVQSFLVGFASELRGLQAQGIQPPNTPQSGTLTPPLGGGALEAPAAAAAPPAPTVVHPAPQEAIPQAPGAAPPPRPPPGPPPLPPLLPPQVQLMAATAPPAPPGANPQAPAPGAAPQPRPPLVPPPPPPRLPPQAQQHVPQQHVLQQQQPQPQLPPELPPPPPPPLLSPQAQQYVSQQQQQQLLQQQATNGGQHAPLTPGSPWAASTPLSPAGTRAGLGSRPGLSMPSRGSAGGPAGLDRAASTPLGLPRTPYHYRPPQRHAGDAETLDARTLSYISRDLEKKRPGPFAGNGPVESLLALTEPVDGKSSDDVSRGGADFLNEMERFIQLVHLRPEGRPSDRWIIGQVCTSLTGTAEEWYIRTEANWPTVEAFMQAFADEFIDTSYVVTLEAQLRALTLEGSCGSLLRTYVGRHKRLVAAIRRSTPLNPDGASCFTDSQAANGLRCGLSDNQQIQSVLRSTFGAAVRGDAYAFVPYSELLAALADYAREHDKPIIARRSKSGASATARATTPMRVNVVLSDNGAPPRLSDNGAPPMLPQADLQVNVIATPVSATSAEQGLFSFECHKCNNVFTHLVKNANPYRVACNNKQCKHEFGFNGGKLLNETRMKQSPQGDAPRGGAGGAPNTGGPSSYRQRLAMQKMAGTVAEIHKQPLKQQSALAIHMLSSDNDETRLAATAYLEQQLDSSESGN